MRFERCCIERVRRLFPLQHLGGGGGPFRKFVSRAMGLRVGVVTGNHEPESGGAWTFSATLTGALKTAESPHTFIVLDETSPGGESKRPAGGRLRRILRQRPDDENINRTEPLAGREGVDLVWLMKPWSEPLSVPYIATVWDLEHRKQPYFPEVSATGWTWSARENVYNALLPRASMIITGTQVGKEEVIRYYHVNPANVMVIPFPAPAGALLVQSLDAARIKEKYRLNGDFLLYPAQFWPHKNHINLLKALRLLRNQTDLDLSLCADRQ